MVNSGKVESFEDLVVWQKAQDLAVSIYTITRSYPKDELYAMTSQLRRAASSISANIAEGFGRQTPADKIHFYTMAYGSLLEVKNFLYLSTKLEYLSERDLAVQLEQCLNVQKLINASKRALKS